MGGALMKPLCLILAFALAAAPASAADIVVDVESGRIVLAESADAPRRPASIVKLMTGYVAFQALADGDVSMEETVAVSGLAARQPPVRLRLKKAQELPFADVLRAALVGSKNDAAMAVAEAVAGSEADFVTLMNKAADDLGMANTRYVNPTGLPAEGQVTTARDTALLAMALLTTFPDRTTLFSNRSVKAAGRRVPTTNPLFGRVSGAMGMKTGFTCAAGYSIAGLIERDGRRILAITLGHRSKSKRLRVVKELIEQGLARAATDEPLLPAEPLGGTPPNIDACSGSTRSIVAEAEPTTKGDAYVPPPLASRSTALPVARSPAPVAQAPRRAELVRPRLPVPPRPAAPTPPPHLSGWGVFLGAFEDEAAAKRIARGVNALATKTTVLPSRSFRRARDGRQLGVIYALTKPQAQALCSYAKQAGQYCLTLSPTALINPKARWRR